MYPENFQKIIKDRMHQEKYDRFLKKIIGWVIC